MKLIEQIAVIIIIYGVTLDIHFVGDMPEYKRRKTYKNLNKVRL